MEKLYYTNSKGEQIDPATMADQYLQRALDKAIREGNQDNIDALQAELDSRTTNNTN